MTDLGDNLVVLDLAAALLLTSPPGGNETHLLTWGCEPLDGRGVTDMLVVTTTVRMLNGVHCHTTHLWPRVPLGLVFVVGNAGLEHWLLCASSARDLTNSGTARRWHDLLGSRWKLDPALAGLQVVADDDAKVSGSARHHTAVAHLGLDVADDGTLWHGPEGEDVAHHECGLLAAVQELAGIRALGGHEELLLLLETNWVPEGHLCERCATSRVMADVSHDTLDVTLTLSIVERAVPRCAYAVLGV